LIGRSRDVSLVVLALTLAGTACSAAVERTPAASGVEFRVHQDTLVIVGTDADHRMITEPLVEVLPPSGGVPAVLALAFDSVGDMGVEGGVGFVSAHAPDGSIVLDRTVDLSGDALDIPGGDYILRLYYRSCDGNCSLLDPPHDWCTIEHEFVAGAEYDITVTGTGFGSADCSLQEAPES
jgi:hypothetical protein